jgi:hypothetical protein
LKLRKIVGKTLGWTFLALLVSVTAWTLVKERLVRLQAIQVLEMARAGRLDDPSLLKLADGKVIESLKAEEKRHGRVRYYLCHGVFIAPGGNPWEVPFVTARAHNSQIEEFGGFDGTTIMEWSCRPK